MLRRIWSQSGICWIKVLVLMMLRAWFLDGQWSWDTVWSAWQNGWKSLKSATWPPNWEVQWTFQTPCSKSSSFGCKKISPHRSCKSPFLGDEIWQKYCNILQLLTELHRIDMNWPFWTNHFLCTYWKGMWKQDVYNFLGVEAKREAESKDGRHADDLWLCCHGLHVETTNKRCGRIKQVNWIMY